MFVDDNSEERRRVHPSCRVNLNVIMKSNGFIRVITENVICLGLVVMQRNRRLVVISIILFYLKILSITKVIIQTIDIQMFRKYNSSFPAYPRVKSPNERKKLLSAVLNDVGVCLLMTIQKN